MKKLGKKLFITSIVVLMFFIFNITTPVQANEFINENNTQLGENDKIIKINLKTGEQTEVDMEEIKKINSQAKGIKGNEITELDGYNPFKNAIRVTPTRSSYRTVIDDTSIFPYNTICKIFGYNANNRAFAGTGILMGKNVVLTAAHVLCDVTNNNQLYSGLTVVPGWNNGLLNNMTCLCTTVYVHEDWINSHSYEYDWALGVLDENIGELTGYLGATTSEGTSMENLSVNSVGYDEDYENGNYQLQTPGTITNEYTNWFKVTGLFGGGMSRWTSNAKWR